MFLARGARGWRGGEDITNSFRGSRVCVALGAGDAGDFGRDGRVEAGTSVPGLPGTGGDGVGTWGHVTNAPPSARFSTGCLDLG